MGARVSPDPTSLKRLSHNFVMTLIMTTGCRSLLSSLYIGSSGQCRARPASPWGGTCASTSTDASAAPTEHLVRAGWVLWASGTPESEESAVLSLSGKERVKVITCSPGSSAFVSSGGQVHSSTLPQARASLCTPPEPSVGESRRPPSYRRQAPGLLVPLPLQPTNLPLGSILLDSLPLLTCHPSPQSSPALPFILPNLLYTVASMEGRTMVP